MPSSRASLRPRPPPSGTTILEKADVPVMPMHDLESLLEDPHMVATDVFPVVDHPTEGPHPQHDGRRRAGRRPRWSRSGWRRASSEHSAEILREAGFSTEEIAAMLRDGVTKAAQARRSDDRWISHSSANQESIRDAVGKNLLAFRRSLLAEEGQGGRLSGRLPPCAGRCRLARHLHPRGVWRLRPRHHRCRDHDAHDLGIRRRHVRRVGRAHERVRAQSGGRVRHQGTVRSACCRRSSTAATSPASR